MDFSLTLFERCSHAVTCGCKKAHDPTYCGVDSCSRGGWPWSTTRKERGKVVWVTWFPYCVLSLPGQVNKFDSNRPLLTVWDCLTLLPHRVRSERWWWWWWIWLVGWWKIIVSHHVCYWIDAILEWFNWTRILKLKLKSKDSLLDVFWQNKPLKPKALHV